MRKIIFVLILFMSAQLAVAQTMSDKQIIKFIESEHKKGSTQQQIASKLLKKGVTMSQIRRVKEKYSKETTDGFTEEKTVKRTRDNEKRQKEEKRARYNNMVIVEDDEENDLEDEDYVLTEDSLDIDVFEGLEDEPEIFGRNIFNNELLTFEPAKNIPIPSSYVLGAGDNVIIDIWGASQTVIDDEISPEGYLMINGAGPLYLAGKSVAEASRYVKEALGDVYAESNINLSVGSVRSITVNVLGEVVTPGSYTLSALSTAFNALYAAGGINGVGTLRDINVYRDGKLLTTIDVYDYILNGKTAGNVHLQDNDVISVGTYSVLTNIDGKIRRPMFYELKEGETLSSLFNYSGGYTGDAYRDKVRVVRKNGREYSLHTVNNDDFASFVMCDGDHVTVDSMLPRFSNMVEINGAVFYPGQYQFGEEIKTVRNLVEAAGGVLEEAFLERAVLHHRNNDNTIEAQAIDVNAILNGTIADVPLRNNDAIFIPSRSEMEGELTVKIFGEVNFSGIYKYAENTTIQDIILQAGGLTRAASMVKIDVYRTKYDPYAISKKQMVESYTFELKNGYIVEGDPQFTLQPFDEVHVRRNPTFLELQNVTIEGEVVFNGKYAISKQEYRLSDLIKDAGGVSDKAYTKGSFLYRKMNDYDIEQRETVVKNTQIQLYEELLNSENVDKALLDSLINAKMSSATTYQVAINLEEAIANPGGEADIVLVDGDILTVPKKSSTVKITGEVRQPTTLTWKKGENLKYYIEAAGGYNDVAKKRGVYVVHMNGNINKLSGSSKKGIEPGCEIVVPRKRYIRNTSTAEIMAYGSTAASIVSMIALIINSFK